jgi:hypothetical protein
VDVVLGSVTRQSHGAGRGPAPRFAAARTHGGWLPAASRLRSPAEGVNRVRPDRRPGQRGVTDRDSWSGSPTTPPGGSTSTFGVGPTRRDPPRAWPTRGRHFYSSATWPDADHITMGRPRGRAREVVLELTLPESVRSTRCPVPLGKVGDRARVWATWSRQVLDRAR